MKAQDIILAMNDIDEKYIKEAAFYKPSNSSLKIWRAVAIAACVCLAVSAVFMTAVVSQNPVQNNALRESLRVTESQTEAAYMPADAASGYAAEADMIYEAAAEEVFYDDYDASPLDAKMAAGSVESGAGKPTLGNSTIQAETPLQAETGTDAAEFSPKIIYNVYMEMQTREYDTAVSEIEQAISANNGYSESQNQSNGSSSYRNANYTIRIPAENLDSFLAQTEEIGTVTYIDKSARDVSEDYYDIQSRLVSAKTKLERLQQLLGEAEDMADIIELESAISDTQWEIDSYTGTIRYYDSQVRYSTVSISLREVYEIVTEEVPLTFGEKIAQAFSQGVKGVGTFFKNLVLWVSASWIWLIIAAAVIAAVILIIRQIRNRKR